jgi:hypothetical protein
MNERATLCFPSAPLKEVRGDAGPHSINTTQVGSGNQPLPANNVEGRNLKVSCTPAAAPDLLLSNNAKLPDFAVDLGILIGEHPTDGHGNPLKQGIGCF